MSDNRYPNNPDDMSLDELLAETKRQAESAPGEMEFNEIMPEILPEDAVSAEAASAQEPLDVPETPFFEPDFGDAFKDYGTYEEPRGEIGMDDSNAPENGFMPAGNVEQGGYAPVNE